MGFDVFNALDLMENKQFLETLKFGIGDGNLQYYLYNWRCPTMNPDRVSKHSCIVVTTVSQHTLHITRFVVTFPICCEILY